MDFYLVISNKKLSYEDKGVARFIRIGRKKQNFEIPLYITDYFSQLDSY